MKAILLIHAPEGLQTAGALTQVITTDHGNEPTVEEIDAAAEQFGHRPCVAVPCILYNAPAPEPTP